MLPPNYMLRPRYLRYSGACRQCATPLLLVERYSPFRVTYFTDLQSELITRCAGCDEQLDSHVEPPAMQHCQLLA